jgi:hypothetical protein
MFPKMLRRAKAGLTVLSLFLTVVASWVLIAGDVNRAISRTTSRDGHLRPTGYPQLISVDLLPPHGWRVGR